MGRAVLLGLCPNSLHKAEVWVYALGLRSGLVHVLFFAPSVVIYIILKLLQYVKLFCITLIFKAFKPIKNHSYKNGPGDRSS